MPNWCSNTIDVSSENLEELNRLRESFVKEDGTLTFSKLVPVEEGQYADKFWGTKWDAQEGHTSEHPYGKPEHYYYFDTAWGPATEFFKVIVAMFPELK